MGCLDELNTKNEIMIRRLAQLPRIAVPLLKKTIKTESQSAMEEDKTTRARQLICRSQNMDITLQLTILINFKRGTMAKIHWKQQQCR